ncbi:MAG: sigma-54-dependent transcriptional regulator [Deferribacterales bacterium]
MPENCPIVIVDDEKEMLLYYELFFKLNKIKNYKLFSSSSEFIRELPSFEPSVAFLDIRMPDYDGEVVLKEIRKRYQDTSVFIVSATQDIDTAVRCIQSGAQDYVVKPIDKNRFLACITSGSDLFRIKKELSKTKEELDRLSFKNILSNTKIITRSPAMEDMMRYVVSVAESDFPVLITGETGTGKELIAETLYNLSKNQEGFIPVNISAYDENMFNDAVFGHVKGAFTGANKDRTGLLGSAGKGIVFLDEIGDLTESSQIKLLRVLQNKEYTPLGSDLPVKTEARIIAATNANLRKKVETGSFREDLYYRLSAHVIEIPPLRDRKNDIELLFNHFYRSLLDRMGCEGPEVPPHFINSLKHHRFPGNVRELQALVQDYVFMFRGRDTKKQGINNFLKKHNIMPVADRSTYDNSFSYDGYFPSLKEMENMLVDQAMLNVKGNQSKAAAMLGITRQALNKRLTQRKTK